MGRFLLGVRWVRTILSASAVHPRHEVRIPIRLAGIVHNTSTEPMETPCCLAQRVSTACRDTRIYGLRLEFITWVTTFERAQQQRTTMQRAVISWPSVRYTGLKMRRARLGGGQLFGSPLMSNLT